MDPRRKSGTFAKASPFGIEFSPFFPQIQKRDLGSWSHFEGTSRVVDPDNTPCFNTAMGHVIEPFFNVCYVIMWNTILTIQKTNNTCYFHNCSHIFALLRHFYLRSTGVSIRWWTVRYSTALAYHARDDAAATMSTLTPAERRKGWARIALSRGKRHRVCGGKRKPPLLKSCLSLLDTAWWWFFTCCWHFKTRTWMVARRQITVPMGQTDPKWWSFEQGSSLDPHIVCACRTWPLDLGNGIDIWL